MSVEKLKAMQAEAKATRDARGISDRQFEVRRRPPARRPCSVLRLSWQQALRSVIVCYYADGSEEFTAMTAVAVRSFLLHTPDVAVGLLTPGPLTWH